MGSSAGGQGTGVPAAPTQIVAVDEAWAQPFGPLDLVELELQGARLLPGFSPTVVRYEAFPDPPSRDLAPSGGAVPPGVLVVEVAAAPARRDAPVLVASPTGEVEELGHGRYRFRGRPGRDHHLTITVGSADGPSRTTTIALHPTPPRVIDLTEPEVGSS